jgi:hypothetical protein
MTFPKLAIAAALLLAALVTPSGASAATVSSSLTTLRDSGKIDATKASTARASYNQARSLNKRLTGTRRTAMTNQIRTIESLARSNRITADRVTPLFTQLQININWFSTRGPANVGTRTRFGDSKIIYQYFAGWGWQFHPLANFSRLNAVWSARKDPKALRSLPSFAIELISWGVMRGGALTWEYYFPFAGSKAPFISSISQGTAIQALARTASATNDPNILGAATAGSRAFNVNAPTGLKVKRDGGLHFIGYSGTRSAIIFNMFAQALDGLHDYADIANDQAARDLFEQGLVAARVELPKSDTGAWSLYQLDGAESNLNYHQVLTEFVGRLCEDTKQEALFCDLHARLNSYLTTKPVISGAVKRIKGKRIYVTFRLSKVSTVTLRSGAGSTTATVSRGKRTFSVARGSGTAVTITAKDLAGNISTTSK